MTIYQRRAQNQQIPDETCQQYQSEDFPEVKDCSKPDLGVCRDCGWPPPEPKQVPHCWPKQNFTRYYASEYALIRGKDAIKKEIYKRGPIGGSYSLISSVATVLIADL